MEFWTFDRVNYLVRYDTTQVLSGNVEPEALLQGCGDVESPIFDRMAAERFGRED